MSKYGVFSRPIFSVFSPNAGNYGPEKTAYLDTFHAVNNKPNNNSFKNKIENIWYKAYIAKTSATQGISRERLYDKLCLESLGDNNGVGNWNFFYKIVIGLAPKYLTNYFNANDNPVKKTRASEHNNIKWSGTKTETFKKLFFPFYVNSGTN